MPKYITIAPQFNPYSVDELLKVPMAVKEEAVRQETEYNKQLDQKAALDALLGNDPQAAEYMREYNEALNELSDAWSQGYYDPQVALYNNKLRELWRDKGMKASAAITLLNQYKEERAKHPDAIGGGKDFNTMLSTMDGSRDYVLGDEIYAKMLASAKQASQDRHIDYGLQRDPVHEGLLKRTEQIGFTPAEQYSILNGEQNPAYTNIYQTKADLLSQIDFTSLPEEDQRKAMHYINKAILDGTLMQRQTSYVNDPSYVKPKSRQDGSDPFRIGSNFSIRMDTPKGENSTQDSENNRQEYMNWNDYRNKMLSTPGNTKSADQLFLEYKKDHPILNKFNNLKEYYTSLYSNSNTYMSIPIAAYGDTGGQGGKATRDAMLQNVYNYFADGNKDLDGSIFIVRKNGEIEGLNETHVFTSESNTEDLIDDIRDKKTTDNPYKDVYLIPEAIEYGIGKGVGPLVAIKSEGEMLWVPASMLGEEYGATIKNLVNTYRNVLGVQNNSDYFAPYSGEGIYSGLPIFQVLGNDITRGVINMYNSLSSHEETNAESANKLYF